MRLTQMSNAYIFFINITANQRAIFLKWNYKTPSIASCHITNENYTIGIRMGILYNTIIIAGLKTEKQTDLSRIEPATLRSTSKRFVAPLGKRLYWPRFSGYFIALVKWLIGRVAQEPSGGRLFVAGSDPATSCALNSSNQHRPHC